MKCSECGNEVFNSVSGTDVHDACFERETMRLTPERIDVDDWCRACSRVLGHGSCGDCMAQRSLVRGIDPDPDDEEWDEDDDGDDEDDYCEPVGDDEDDEDDDLADVAYFEAVESDGIDCNGDVE